MMCEKRSTKCTSRENFTKAKWVGGVSIAVAMLHHSQLVELNAPAACELS